MAITRELICFSFRQSQPTCVQQPGAEQEHDQLQDRLGDGELRAHRGVQAALQEVTGKKQKKRDYNTIFILNTQTHG